MKAIEAKNISNEAQREITKNNNVIADKICEDIFTLIRKAASEGHYILKIEITNFLVREKLTNLGYCIYQLNQNLFSISWDRPCEKVGE